MSLLALLAPGVGMGGTGNTVAEPTPGEPTRWRVAAIDCYVPGAQTQQMHTPGAAEADMHTPGAAAQQ